MARRVRVWDPVVRAGHWALVAAMVLGWATTWPALGGWHRAVGWAGVAVLVVRIAWGFVGRGQARFAAFVRSPRATWTYARLFLAGRAPRYLGHNPLGACMVVAFCACIGGLALTGWLYTTDAFWGDETVERVHVTLAWTVVVLAVLHVVGVVVASVRHRENLIAAMLHGDKREAAAGDVI